MATSASYIATSTNWPRPDTPGLVDGRHDPERQQRRRVDVADARADARADRAGLAGRGDEPAHRLGDDVERGPVGVRALAGARVAEPTDGAVDEPRVDLRQRLVAEAEPVEHAGAEVLDDHVGVRTISRSVSRSASCWRSSTMLRFERLTLAK